MPKIQPSAPQTPVELLCGAGSQTAAALFHIRLGKNPTNVLSLNGDDPLLSSWVSLTKRVDLQKKKEKI